MGLGSYFKSSKPAAPDASTTSNQVAVRESEKSQSSATRSPQRPGLMNTARDARNGSSRASLAPSISSNRSSFLDDIKHEVMANYLYQQQCSRLWVNDSSGESEGILLRKARNQYLACPPQLAYSPFATACAELNVQVNRPLCPSAHFVDPKY